MQPLSIQDLHPAELLPDTTGDVRDLLASVASDMDARFNLASSKLADAVGAIDQIIMALRDSAGAFEQGAAAAAVDDLTSAAASLTEVPTQVSSRSGYVASIRAASSALQRHLADVQRFLQVLQIYAMNVKIASGGAEAFVDFAEHMDEKLAQGVTNGKALDAALDALETSVWQIQQIDGLLAAECSRVVPKVPEQLIRDATALRAHQATLAELAQSISEKASSIQSALGTALGAIQVGDRIRQRLEHVTMGCVLLDAALANPTIEAEDTTAIRQHVLGLLGALTAAASSEYQTELAALLGSMSDLKANAGELIVLRTSDFQSDDGVFLRRLENGIAEAGNMIGQLNRAAVQAGTTLQVIHRTVAEVSSQATTIRSLRMDVRQMAINIALRCRTAEGIGRPVMIIANEIRTFSDRLDGVIDQIVQVEDTLIRTSGDMDAPSQAHNLAAQSDLSGSLNAIRTGAEQSEQAMKSVTERSAGVLDLLGHATAVLEDCLAYGDALEMLAEKLCSAEANSAAALPAVGDDTLVRGLLDELARTYSMASERLIHNAYLLPGMVPIGGDLPQSNTNEDDDALF